MSARSSAADRLRTFQLIRRGTEPEVTCGDLSSFLMRNGSETNTRHLNLKTDMPGPLNRADSLTASLETTTAQSRRKCPPPAQGLFCLLFVAAWTKSKAAGGPRPAGFALVFSLKHLRQQQDPGVSAPDADLLSCDDKKVGKETFGPRPAWHARSVGIAIAVTAGYWRPISCHHFLWACPFGPQGGGKGSQL